MLEGEKSLCKKYVVEHGLRTKGRDMPINPSFSSWIGLLEFALFFLGHRSDPVK